jgi:hypothetical protein
VLSVDCPKNAASNLKSKANSGSCLNAMLPAPPDERTTAREDQAGQTSANGGIGDGGRTGKLAQGSH